jgi:tetratricopeptide (TPR) repeat protein
MKQAQSTKLTCKGTRKDGEPCQSHDTRFRGYCEVHKGQAPKPVAEVVKSWWQGVQQRYRVIGLLAFLVVVVLAAADIYNNFAGKSVLDLLNLARSASVPSIYGALLLIIVTGVSASACIYLAYRRNSLSRRCTVALFLGTLALSLSAAGISLYMSNSPPDQVIISVADFDGPEPQKYRVTETVIERLRSATKEYDDVQIVALNQTITEQQGSEAARVIGEKHKATIVIWGWYGVTQETVPLSVHFEVLRPPKDLPQLGSEAKGEPQSIAVAEMENFALQTRLSEEMAYLTLFTVGMIRYSSGDWDGAITYLSDALSESAEPVPALGRSIVYSWRAQAYSSKEDYTQAIADFDRVIELSPEYAWAYRSRADAYRYRGDPKQAITDYTRAIELSPDNAAAYLGRAYAYSDTGDQEKAQADFGQVVSLETDCDACDYYRRGLAYVQLGDYDLAIAEFEQSVQSSPDEAWTYVSRGHAYGDHGDYELALSDFSHAIRLDPENAEAYYRRGYTYGEKGDYEAAIKDLNRAIQLEHDDPWYYYERGYYYGAKGDPEAAIKDLDRAIQLKPDVACYYSVRGHAYSDKADYEHALADLNQAVLLGLKDADTYYRRGYAYREKGDYEAAIGDLDRAIQLDPDDSWYFLERGQAYREVGDHNRAISDYDQAIELGADCQLCALVNRGATYSELGNHDRAIADFDQAIELDPNSAWAYYNRGLTYAEKGDDGRSLADFNEAIRLDSEYAQAYYQRGILYVENGKKTKAIADFKKALRFCEEESLRTLVVERLTELAGK